MCTRKTKRISGVRERFRSGAGHVHLGSQYIKNYYKIDPVKLISLMDIVCGNTLVLLDRDPNNARRRKHYGRAGEHRVKSYGVEYRVPSNFWLKHYVLWSTVSALLRNAVNLFDYKEIDELFKTINMSDIRKAINENDYDLALSNYKKYTDFLMKHKIVFDGGLDISKIDMFTKWATSKDPLEYINCGTIEEIMGEWEEHGYEFLPGLEDFLAENYA